MCVYVNVYECICVSVCVSAYMVLRVFVCVSVNVIKNSVPSCIKRTDHSWLINQGEFSVKSTTSTSALWHAQT